MFEPSAKQISEVVTAGLAHENVSDVVSIPTLLVSRTWIEAYTQDKPPPAQAVLDWLREKGLLGDRTLARLSLGGYPKLFRDLLNPPPWVEVQPEDCEGQLTPGRDAQLSPAYQQLVSDSNARAEFKDYHAAKRDALFSGQPALKAAMELAHELESKKFDELIGLAQILGSKTERLYEAVFEYEPEYGLDDMSTAIGAPDLFLWTPHSLPPFWFFAEVKGASDFLRPSQAAWVASHWENIRGHFMLIHVVDIEVSSKEMKRNDYPPDTQ